MIARSVDTLTMPEQLLVRNLRNNLAHQDNQAPACKLLVDSTKKGVYAFCIKQACIQIHPIKQLNIICFAGMKHYAPKPVVAGVDTQPAAIL